MPPMQKEAARCLPQTAACRQGESTGARIGSVGGGSDDSPLHQEQELTAN